MRNILVVVASSHKNANTDTLSGAFIRGAEQAGHKVRKVFLGGKTINGCLGCNACRFGKPCVQKDAMNELYPLFDWCDTIVMASPLYFWTLSARLKAFLERLYATSMPDDHPQKGRYERYPEKDCVLLMTAADDFFWTFEQAVSYYRFNCVRYLGWRDLGMVLAGGCGGCGTARRVPQVYLDEAYRFGRNL